MNCHARATRHWYRRPLFRTSRFSLVISIAASLFFQRANGQPRHPDFSGLWVRASRTCEPPKGDGGSCRMEIREDDPLLKITIHATQRGATRQLPLAYKSGESLHYTGL